MNLFSVFHKKNSGEIARARLKSLLVTDKTQCSPEVIQMIKNDIIHIISRYMEIDSDGMEIQMTQIKPAGRDAYVPALYANIPVREVSGKGIY